MAAGETVNLDARDVLADVLAVLSADPGAQWADLAGQLAARWPDCWAGASAEAVSAQCRAAGVPSVDVKSGGRTLKGCRRDAVLAATGSR